MSKRTRGNGAGTLYQRKGRPGWYASVSQNGRRKIYHAATKSEADQLLAAAKVAKENGELVMAKSQTLGTYLATWLDQVVKPQRRPGTYRGYEQLVRVHLVPGLGRVRVDRLTPAQVQAFINAKLQDPGLSPRTVQYMYAVLRAALGRAVKWGIVARNVADLVDGPTVEREEVKPFTRAEAAQLLAAARGDRLEALYSVALSLGLRQGEALGLQWDDVDLEAGVLHVRQQLLRTKGKLVLSPTKTKKSRRDIRMPASIAAALRDHRQRAVSGGKAAVGFVFSAANGSPLDARNVVRSYKALLKRAKLSDRRFHDLRHGAASLMLAQGIAPKTLQGILGHSQWQVTMDLYSHVLPELFDDAAARMDAIFAR
ncbi:MAG: tyrosine recombinase XerC [Candidatus Dormibacterales bacterium]